MVITIKKGANKKDIEAAVKRFTKKRPFKPSLVDFYGKLKGKFGSHTHRIDN